MEEVSLEEFLYFKFVFHLVGSVWSWTFNKAGSDFEMTASAGEGFRRFHPIWRQVHCSDFQV